MKIIVWVRSSGIVVVLAQFSGTDSHAKVTIKNLPPDWFSVKKSWGISFPHR